jgi:hypothetical protein
MLKTLYPSVLALGSLQGFAHGNFGKPDIKTAWSGKASGRRNLGIIDCWKCEVGGLAAGKNI